MRKIKDRSLYLVISEEYSDGRPAIWIAERAVAGGVDIIQMREKNKSMQELVEIGSKMRDICQKSSALFIVNDDPTLALQLRADGVHLGQEDIARFPIKKARDILGPERIIGVSTHSIEEAKEACAKEVDYIAFGPIFPTEAKGYHIGKEGIKEVLALVKKPVFFIGGINLSNIAEVLAEGGRNIALIRPITQAVDVESAVKKFKKALIRPEGAR
ncbi:MAG: thiamine phosphate synthase [Candidatus Omnitrophica bacterium]|nr:thiamine phosphate synthase [Candidatus Omnitrophota bacterium]MCM8791416.1 thiamine phosphate synthase [Candidatus Omnitrophota bacterium]